MSLCAFVTMYLIIPALVSRHFKFEDDGGNVQHIHLTGLPWVLKLKINAPLRDLYQDVSSSGYQLDLWDSV